jgi:hypothetical protein
MRSPATSRFAIASLLVLVLLALSAAPAAAGSVWRAKGAEDTAFRLANCMRTGGHVTKYGTCLGWGSGKYSKVVPVLKRSDRISNQVSWPWAKKSVQLYGTRTCWIGHSRSGSTVDKRFASAALKHVANGENMGCAMYGGAQKSTLFIVRMWQAEKAWGGPHWRQIKDDDFKSAGVGVARYGKRKTQIVMNFYGKVVN